MPKVFISYPAHKQDLAENIREQFTEFGVSTWVYSYDRTAGADAWVEIEEQLTESSLVLFMVGPMTHEAPGQSRELDLALSAIHEHPGDLVIVPLVVDGLSFSDVPEALRRVNGFALEPHTTKTLAWKVTTQFFPELAGDYHESPWNYPRPGDWLQICQMDEQLEQYFKLGEHVYFRRLSPMGFFECYCPKIAEVFWFWPPNLKRADPDHAPSDELVPTEYRALTQYHGA